jgi:hypothetical protein
MDHESLLAIAMSLNYIDISQSSRTQESYSIPVDDSDNKKASGQILDNTTESGNHQILSHKIKSFMDITGVDESTATYLLEVHFKKINIQYVFLTVKY